MSNSERGMEIARFVAVRVDAIDKLRRCGKRRVPVYLFLASYEHRRVRIWAQREHGPLFASMKKKSARCIGRIVPKQTKKQIALIVRAAIEGREVVPCG